MFRGCGALSRKAAAERVDSLVRPPYAGLQWVLHCNRCAKATEDGSRYGATSVAGIPLKMTTLLHGLNWLCKGCVSRFFPECVARVPVSFWGPGVEGVLFARRCVTARSRSQPFATVRNRSREGRMAVPVVSSAEGVILEVSNVALLRFAWQAWHFVTFRRVL